MAITLNQRFEPVCCEGFTLMKDYPNSCCVICGKEYNTREVVEFVLERKYPFSQGASHDR